MTDSRTLALIDDLRVLPAETAWAEFKHNNTDAQLIGRLLSALSNAARLADKPCAYAVWGIQDGTHAAIGTTFEPSRQTQNGQPLELWLSQRLQPAIDFRFQTVDYHGTRLVLLEIPAAPGSPVEFERTALVRIGSTTPRLADHPERLKALWARMQPYAWEAGVAASFLTGDDVLARLDYTAYFDLTGQPLPDNRQGIFAKLVADRLVLADVGGRWSITHLGAILFAKRLDEFPPALARKALRFVAYAGPSRADTVTHRLDVGRGYALGFTHLTDYLDGLIPRHEAIGRALREAVPVYPTVAIRELVANALIHQDMTITGAGPLVELFRAPGAAPLCRDDAGGAPTCLLPACRAQVCQWPAHEKCLAQ